MSGFVRLEKDSSRPMGSALRDTSSGGEYTQGSIPQCFVENDTQENGLKCVKVGRASDFKKWEAACAPDR
jgi:hypothetical protein